MLTYLFLSAAAVGCDASDVERTVDIGVAMPVSGTLAQAGMEVTRGMELALDEVNGSRLLGEARLALTHVDTRGTVEGSVDAFRKLLSEEHIPVVLGPFTSSATAEIIAVVDAAGVVAFSPVSSASGLGARSGWLFRSALTLDHTVPYGISVSKAHLHYRTVATIFNDGDTYATSSNNRITEVVAADLDLSIVSAQTFTRAPGEPSGDYSSQLTKILNADPDVLFVSGLPLDQRDVIVQAHTIGLTRSTYISPQLSLVDVKQINETRPGAAENAISFQIWLADSDIPENKAFVANYMMRHGVGPNDFTARGYGAVHILAHALATAKKNYEAASIRESLANIRGYPTIFGDFSFDAHGDAIYRPFVAQVRGNVFAVLQP